MGSGRTLASHPSHARARDPDQPAGQVEEETAFSSSHQCGRARARRLHWMPTSQHFHFRDQ